ncbi:hypothetical protein [Sphingomonas koreensis]|uniref:hypothetical protein n=1 Tax=Sphingomonas koreensis TaxID=93064 RepID=UPI000C250999|nr:hypothetical protein [Sphingomonas koreensis]
MGTGFERRPGPRDKYFVVVDDDPRHEDPQIGAPQFGVGASDLGAETLTEPLDRGVVDPPRLAANLLCEAALGFGKRRNRCTRLSQLGGEYRFARTHDFLSDEIKQTAKPPFGSDALAPHTIVILAATFFSLVGPVEHIGK